MSILFVAVFVVVALALWLGQGGRLPAAGVDLGSDDQDLFAGVALREGGPLQALRKLQNWAQGRTTWIVDEVRGPSTLEASLLEQAVSARRTAPTPSAVNGWRGVAAAANPSVAALRPP